MATNYPGSLDTSSEQPSPSATTEMDDAGFEHDVVHTNHSGAIIALETKVGTGSSTAVADSVLAGTGAGTSGWTTSPTLSGLEVDGNLGVGTSSPVDPLHVVGDVTIEFSDDGALAQPEVTLLRESTTPSDGDYLGQLKFAGKNDVGGTVNYAKITGKISDVTDATEDGLIEIANIKAGSQSIGYRFTSTDLKLINGRGLEVAGDVAVDTDTLYVDTTNSRVGIGTTSPSSPLHVKEDTYGLLTLDRTGNANVDQQITLAPTWDGSGNTALDFNIGTQIMRLTEAGRVGIGTTSPASELEISTATGGGASATELRISSTGQSSSWSTTNPWGRLDFWNEDGSGGGAKSHASLRAVASEALAQYSDLEFHVTNGSAADITAMTIRGGTGRVGIGTTSPETPIHIVTTNKLGSTFTGTTDGEGLRVDQSNYTAGNYVSLIEAKADDGNAAPNVRIGAMFDGGGSHLVFGTSNSYVSGITNEAMTIDNTGRVGIGTTSPSYALDVEDPTQAIVAINDSGGTVGAHTNSRLFFQAGGSVAGQLGFSNTSSGFMVVQNHNGAARFGTLSSDAIYLMTNGSYRVTVDSAGAVSIPGSLSKGSGSFRIPHPLPEMSETHHLVHSFVEAPQADNIYRGRVALVDGAASVNIDEVAGMSAGTFVLLNRDVQAFTSNETGPCRVWSSVSDGVLSITAEHDDCDHEISWLVIGERQDQHMYDTEWTDDDGRVIVEPLRPVDDLDEENQTVEAQVAALEAEA